MIDSILTHDMVKWAAAKRNEGYPVADIAAALGVCDKTVFRALKKYGYNKVRPILEYKG